MTTEPGIFNLGENRSGDEGESHQRDFSVVILAGGRSERMGHDKAFLTHKGRQFISIISEKMLEISSDVIVAIGAKEPRTFESALEKRVRILNDNQYLMNPMGGILSALARTRNEYTAIVACDSPLVKTEVIRFLFEEARYADAAVPIWEDGYRIEPLCAVYNAKEAVRAGMAALEDGKIGPKHMVSYLREVKYLPMSRLRTYDPQLSSFLNINTQDDYLRLREDRICSGFEVPVSSLKKINLLSGDKRMSRD